VVFIIQLQLTQDPNITIAAMPAGRAKAKIPWRLYSTPTATPKAPNACAKVRTFVGITAIANIVTQKEYIEPKKSAKLSRS
jgi:hypothetical protein